MPRKSATSGKRLPTVTSDRAAATVVSSTDLTRYDLRAMTPARFEFAPKSARLNMRLPEELLSAVKHAAADRGMPYQRLVRQILEHALAVPR